LCIADFRNVSRRVAGRIVADVSKEYVAFIPKGHILEDRNLKLIAVCVGRRGDQLLNDHTSKRGYWELKEEALDRTVWRTGFGRVYGPVVRQATE
jgi:hypothetical protein